MTANNRIDVIDMASEEYSNEIVTFSCSEEANAFLALDDDYTSPELSNVKDINVRNSDLDCPNLGSTISKLMCDASDYATRADDVDNKMFDVDALGAEEVLVAGQNENVVEEVVDAKLRLRLIMNWLQDSTQGQEELYPVKKGKIISTNLIKQRKKGTLMLKVQKRENKPTNPTATKEKSCSFQEVNTFVELHISNRLVEGSSKRAEKKYEDKRVLRSRSLKEFDLLKWDQQVVSELVALRNFARRYGSRFCTHSGCNKVPMLKSREFGL
ncbi:hypothetical protein Tco_0180087 [Tanacetum coccineum]